MLKRHSPLSVRAALLIIPSGLLALGSASVFAQISSAPMLDIDRLRDLAAARPRPDQGLAVSYEVFQDPQADSSRGHIAHLARSVLVDAATGRFRVEKVTQTEQQDGHVHADWLSLAFDGDVQSAFLPDQMIGVVMEGGQIDGLVESGLWGVMLLGEPRPGGFGIDDGSLESFLARGVVREQLEMVGEAACHVIDAYSESVRYATVWIDVERGLLPMKRVTYGASGEPSGSITVDSVFLLEPEGLWFPERWASEIRARGETLRTWTAVAPESVEIDPPLADGDFRIDFPPGATIADQIAGVTYRVSDSGGIGEVLFERTDDEWNPIDPPGADEGASQTGVPAVSVFDTLQRLAQLGLEPAVKAPNQGTHRRPENARDEDPAHSIVSGEPHRVAPATRRSTVEPDRARSHRLEPRNVQANVKLDHDSGRRGNSAFSRPGWIVPAVTVFVALVAVAYFTLRWRWRPAG